MPTRAAQGDGETAGPSAHRRGFLKAGFAVSALPAVAGAAWPSLGLAGDSALQFYKVMYDRDDAAAAAFGRAAAAAGHDALGIGGDLTALWYDLQRRWKDGPVAIAGLTNPAAAMCLEMMAWDVGMRTVYRADHKPLAGGGVRHVVTAPEAMLSRTALLDTGAAWSAGASSLVGACPAVRSTRATLTLESAPSLGPALAEPLVSWVVAPVRRA